MKTLVTGALGQLGTDVVRRFEAAGHEVVGIDIDEADLTDAAQTAQVIADHSPELVIHCAAYTAVDKCEEEPDLARLVNETGSRNVAGAARARGSRLIAISTDYVFDGAKDGPYVEGDEPNPQSVYGVTKLAGERATLEAHPDAAIVRTSWVCGEHGGNIARTALRVALATDGPLRFVDDQHGCPTFTADLADGLLRVATAELTGVMHVTNQGPTTWFEFVREVLRCGGFDPARVEPIKTHELDPPRPARRPVNSVLENRRLAEAGIELLPPWRDSLPGLVASLLRQEAGG